MDREGTLDRPASVPSFAVVFKTHAWDGFIARQLERYRRRIGRGDLFVFLDETNGSLGPVPHDRVVRARNADLIAAGFADRAERGSLIWWNTDYPNHHFVGLHPDYDFYMFVEYDTWIGRDVAGFIDEAASAGADLVTLPNRVAKSDWMWTRHHLAAYPFDVLSGSLNCMAVCSNRAAHLLRRRRLEMSRDSEAGRVAFWPGNEVFVATEIGLAGLKTMSLQAFGNADGFEWYPPHLEDDLDETAGLTFLHPVLDEARFMASLLKFSPLVGYLHPASRLHRALRRFPRYRDQFVRALGRRVRMRAGELASALKVRLFAVGSPRAAAGQGAPVGYDARHPK